MSVTASPQAPSAAHIARIYKTHLSGGRATLGDIFGGHIETSSDGRGSPRPKAPVSSTPVATASPSPAIDTRLSSTTFVGSWTSTRWPPACSMNPPPPRRSQPWPP